MRYFLSFIVISGLLVGCGSKELVKDVNQPTEETKTEQPAAVTATKDTTVAAIIQQEAVIAPIADNKAADHIINKSKPEKVVTKPEEMKPVAKTAIQDSIDVSYMIRPNDYLVKIAINEYGRPTMWRKIWHWNYNMIGENPNLIYPYRELLLKKPIEYANKTEFSFYDYTVRPNDTLWSIAKNEYGNNLAWIVILRDNYDTLGESYDKLEADTILKLRTKLY